MKKRLSTVLLLATLVGGATFFGKLPPEWKERVASFFQIEPGNVVHPLTGPPVARDDRTVLIASFNIQVFGESKLDKPDVVAVLAAVIRQFDVVAIQEVRSKNQDVVPHFVRTVNAQGANYDYILGPRLGRTTSKDQYAVVFDTDRIEVDPNSIYTVPDPNDQLHRPPLVASFRARAPPPNEAFTFTLINIHTDPDETKQELDALDDVFLAVRNDGRGEDDIILLGDLNVDDHHFGQLGQLSGIAWAISGTPTNMRGNKLYDNIVFARPTTVEFASATGVFDWKAAFGLDLDAALKVSDHNPIWAQFSAYEGGAPGRVATNAAAVVR